MVTVGGQRYTVAFLVGDFVIAGDQLLQQLGDQLSNHITRRKIIVGADVRSERAASLRGLLFVGP